jgi:uncharacterized protein
MAMKLPTDLSPKWWPDNKPATMKKTGFGAALRELEAATKKFAALRNHSHADFMAVLESYGNAMETLKKVDKARLPKVHDDVKPVITKYQSLISTESGKIQNKVSQYINAQKGLEGKISKEKDKLAAAVGFVQSIINNLETMSGQLDSFKSTPDKVKQTVKLVEDFKTKAKAHEKAINAVGKDVADLIEAAGVALKDMADNKDLKAINNGAASGQSLLGDLERKADKLIKALRA